MDTKLRKAHKIIVIARRNGDEWLLWSLELYTAQQLYSMLLSKGYVWVKQERA